MASRIALLALGLVFTLCLPLQAEIHFIPLGDLGGGEGAARGINGTNQVVGWSRTASGEPRAFLWQDGVMADLGIPDSIARAINERGHIVGYYQVSGNDHGFVWDRGTLTDLGVGRAYAVNDRGDIVGESAGRAVLWIESERNDLALPVGATGCWANGLNNRRQVVGACILSNGDRGAFLWDAGEVRDLGTLGGSYAEAASINDHGIIVGGSTASTVPGQAYLRAFLWDRGSLLDLGTLGGPFAVATATTSNGSVAGESHTASGITHAFLLDNRGLTDLGPLSEYSSAWAMNNRGVVVGSVGVGAAVRSVLWNMR
jgi:probable HAF family extracellular repeat protein